jgi:serine phosphatase RsbU (regulator of sigma subunit)/energy-coupling factor transporter ATP-binding protein EcfA2
MEQNVVAQPEASLVRITTDGEPVGMGFLVTRDTILTCAHVVTAAVGQTDSTMSTPKREMILDLDFPFFDSAKCKAKVMYQLPRIGPDDNPRGDLALLQLVAAPPEEAQPARLVLDSELYGRAVRAYGVPRRRAAGVWAYAVARHRLGNGWLQVEDAKEPGKRIQRGYSGGPIADQESGDTFGMVVAEDTQETDKIGFAIPVDILLKELAGTGVELSVVTTRKTGARDLRQELSKEHLGLRVQSNNPYRGLNAFTEDDAQYFFGRERVVDQLLERLGRERRFLAVAGPSGSGKSSLVLAGLIPNLEQGKVPGSSRWGVFVVRQYDDPLRRLADLGLMGASEGLVEAAAKWLKDNSGKDRLLLVMDQFEEILVSSPEPIREDFIAQLLEVLDSRVRITIILVFRLDFLERFHDEASSLVEKWIADRWVPVPRYLGNDELRAIIEEPAVRAGVGFENGLVDNIISDVLDVDSVYRTGKRTARVTVLPLLEFALTELWNTPQRANGGELKRNHYRALGGVMGGLSQWADDVYYDLDPKGRKLAKRILTALVHVSDESQGPAVSRGRKSLAALYRRESEALAVQAVVQRLVSARLLVTTHNERSGQDSVELIHDALIYRWELLQKWLQDDRAFLVWHQEIERRTLAWLQTEPTMPERRDTTGKLLRGEDLAEAQAWLSERGEDISEAEREFIHASAEQERREEARDLRLQQLEREAREFRLRQLRAEAQRAGIVDLGSSAEQQQDIDAWQPIVPEQTPLQRSGEESREGANELQRSYEDLRVENQVLRQKVQEQERIEQELRIARLIQQTLLPKKLPELPGYDVAAYYQPAREVGGDFYDFLELEDGRLGLVVGDVTDKGVPAALVMAMTRTMLRAAAQRHFSPGEVLKRVNDVLVTDIPPNMFVTCLYAILDPESGRIVYANAGHDLPYRRRAGRNEGAEELRATGMPLGLLPGMAYEEKEIVLEKGESVLFYSDGLVEAHDPRHDMFGFPRLQGLVGAHRSGGSSLVGFLLSELARFTGEDWEQEDDITLVTLERSEEL